MKKIIITILLTASMLSACGGGNPESANTMTVVQGTTTEQTTNKASTLTSPIKDFKYELVDGGLILKKYSGRDKVVYIANEYELDGVIYPVLDIDGGMFFTSSVKTVILSEGITEIAHPVFNGAKIELLYLPSTLTCIYDDSLAYISRSLTDIYFGGTEDQWNQIYTIYEAGNTSDKVEDKDSEGAGVAVADKLNSLIGHNFDLSSVALHYDTVETDLIER